MSADQHSIIQNHTEIELPPDVLEQRIAELSAYIEAATYRLLYLVRQYDEREAWATGGFRTCAHLLSFRTGIDLGAARERVRVARALSELPRISIAFEKAEVSYSKVRAVTRIADRENEQDWLDVALAGTASQLEKMVRACRRAGSLEADQAHRCHKDRYLRYFHDDQGMWVVRGRLPAEMGAAVVKALEMAEDELFQQGVSAETSRRLACDAGVVTVTEGREGQTLDVGRRTRKISTPLRRALHSRDECCQFPGCTHTRFLEAHHVRHWAEGGRTDLENLALICPFHHRLVHEGGFTMEASPGDGLVFRDARGRPLPPSPDPLPVQEDPVRWLARQNADAGLKITASTNAPRWDGTPVDYHYAVAAMLR